jgi:hypothetical protein
MIRVNHFCEICNEERKPSNGWVMARVGKLNSTSINQITFMPWDMKKEKDKHIKHLCGSDCQSKFLLRITSNWTSTHTE